MQRAIGRLRAGGGFNLGTLWALGEAGLWYDQPDLSSGYQDSAGTTALYAPGAGSIDPPVGLRLDKRLGLVLGPELITNGDFSSATGWTLEAGWAIAGAVATFTNPDSTTNFTNLYQTPLTVGKTYRITFTVTALGAAGIIALRVGTGTYYNITATGSYSLTIPGATSTLVGFQHIAGGSAGAMSFTVDNFSVRLLDGNHSTQATAAARPVETGRVNLLLKTEAIVKDATWVDLSTGVTTITQGQTDPNGGTTAVKLTGTDTNTWLGQDLGTGHAGAARVLDLWVRADVPYTASLKLNVTAGSGLSQNISVTTAWQRFNFPATLLGTDTGSLRAAINHGVGNNTYIWHPDCRPGLVPGYQRVTDANNYDASVAPLAEKFDGVDDGYGTATFAAGALTSNMDCFVAVKRLSAARGVLISQTTANSGHYIGIFESAAGYAPTGLAGTPTTYVDGVALAANTGGALNTALTVGDWHVLEFRNLDLSAWTSLSSCQMTGFAVSALENQVVLCPAQTDAVRGNIRRALAAKVGATVV